MAQVCPRSCRGRRCAPGLDAPPSRRAPSSRRSSRGGVDVRRAPAGLLGSYTPRRRLLGLRRRPPRARSLRAPPPPWPGTASERHADDRARTDEDAAGRERRGLRRPLSAPASAALAGRVGAMPEARREPARGRGDDAAPPPLDARQRARRRRRRRFRSEGGRVRRRRWPLARWKRRRALATAGREPRARPRRRRARRRRSRSGNGPGGYATRRGSATPRARWSAGSPRSGARRHAAEATRGGGEKPGADAGACRARRLPIHALPVSFALAALLPPWGAPRGRRRRRPFREDAVAARRRRY